jgi:hypothetical protein
MNMQNECSIHTPMRARSATSATLASITKVGWLTSMRVTPRALASSNSGHISLM